MFLHPLPKDIPNFHVYFTDFAVRFFLKNFRKKYKGNVWKITEQSILSDLSRIQNKLQFTQQVDELKRTDGKYLFKYDFAVAKTNRSPKASGNRCICLLDLNRHDISILTIYAKTDLPKNSSETQWIKMLLQNVV